jgi:integrase
MGRGYGIGRLYEKHGSYYGRWRTSHGRLLNGKIGPVRAPSTADGYTRAQAERTFRKLQDDEEKKPSAPVQPRITVSHAAEDLRRKLALQGSRKSYLGNCASMQRCHIDPDLGPKPLRKVTRTDVEALASAMLNEGLKPKTVRNTLAFLHQIFEHAIDREWTYENPVRRATRPRRRRAGDTEPDLQFLTLPELDAVLRAIPDEVVVREPAPTRRGRRGPAPPPPPDVLGPVVRVVVLAAAMTGLRQSELLGLRCRDVDWGAQRIRVRNTYVRGEHSTDGKSDLSTRRSVPMADRLATALDAWSQRTFYTGDEDLVFAHPQTGNPLDGGKVTTKFKEGCIAAGVRPIRFHDLRHTFATTLAASGKVSLRTLQEFLGHADAKTTQIYAHYAPSAEEVAMVNAAFGQQMPEPAPNSSEVQGRGETRD